MSENCEYRGRPCYGSVPTIEGQRTTWSIVKRLSTQGGTDNEIDTSTLVTHCVFEQPPKEVAELYSDIGVKHSCARCTDLIEGVVVTLGLTPPKPES